MSEQTKHTPGPWEQNVELVGGRVNHQIIGNHQIIADVYPSQPSQTELMANARLIAAAPELLEVCKFAYNELSGTPRPEMLLMLREQLKQAIAKATGK